MENIVQTKNFQADQESAFRELKHAAIRRCSSQEEFDTVIRAYEFACDVFSNEFRNGTEPFVLHSINLANIVVSEIGLGCKSIVTALLHDVVANSEYTLEDINSLFGEKITSMVDGLSRVDKLFAGNNNSQSDSFRNMLMTMNDDIRVIIIKLADVLLNVRRLSSMQEKQKAKVLSEAMYVFVPLAHRLGLYRIKSEMENSWMQFYMPEEYFAIENKLRDRIASNSPFIQEYFIDPISTALHAALYNFNIYRRIKTPYSIWNKMQKRGVSFDEIYDIFAVRIVFFPKGTESEPFICRHIESIISSHFQSNPERTRDWIDHPKDTGYQALHATYLCKGHWVEVQIRSKRMDDIAERGLAAHWKYKESGSSSTFSEDWIALIRETLENKDIDALSFFDQFHAGSLSPEICVFTPKGEPRILPKESTVLDFAYYLHSKIGDKALAAKVNQKLVPLSHTLRGGDQVEIITADSQHPNLQWLSFLKTSKARNNVSDALEMNIKQYREQGQKLLMDKLKDMCIQPQARVLNKICAAFDLPTREDLYGKIGTGNIKLDRLESILKNNSREKIVRYWRLSFPELNTVPEYEFATCCHPRPGSRLIGLIDNDIIVVHNRNCKTCAKQIEEPRDKEAFVNVEWEKYLVRSRLVYLKFTGKDRIGVMFDMDRILMSFLNINVRKFSINTHDGIFEGGITLYVQITEIRSNGKNYSIDSLITELLKVKGMQKVNEDQNPTE